MQRYEKAVFLYIAESTQALKQKGYSGFGTLFQDIPDTQIQENNYLFLVHFKYGSSDCITLLFIKQTHKNLFSFLQPQNALKVRKKAKSLKIFSHIYASLVIPDYDDRNSLFNIPALQRSGII